MELLDKPDQVHRVTPKPIELLHKNDVAFFNFKPKHLQAFARHTAIDHFIEKNTTRLNTFALECRYLTIQ